MFSSCTLGSREYTPVINLPSHSAMLLSKQGKEKQNEKLASLVCWR
jgi:hypothetical protein